MHLNQHSSCHLRKKLTNIASVTRAVKVCVPFIKLYLQLFSPHCLFLLLLSSTTKYIVSFLLISSFILPRHFPLSSFSSLHLSTILPSLCLPFPLSFISSSFFFCISFLHQYIFPLLPVLFLPRPSFLASLSSFLSHHSPSIISLSSLLSFRRHSPVPVCRSTRGCR